MIRDGSLKTLRASRSLDKIEDQGVLLIGRHITKDIGSKPILEQPEAVQGNLNGEIVREILIG